MLAAGPAYDKSTQMKRVLIVTFDFPPQGGTGAIRMAKFAKYLPQFGWQPVVVCSDGIWNRDDGLAAEIPSSVYVRRVAWAAFVRAARPTGALPPQAGGSASARLSLWGRLKRLAAATARRLLIPDVHVLWTGAAERACLEVLGQYSCDAIITSTPPFSMHLVGEWLHRRTGLPWIADFRDVWTAGRVPEIEGLGRFSLALHHRTERRLLANCNRAVVVTEPIARNTADTFGPDVASKLITITNGFDPEDYGLAQPITDTTRFNLVYVGTVIAHRVENAFPEGLRLALRQSEKFREKAQIRFVGQFAPEYLSRLAGLEANVEISGFADHRTATQIMRQAHCLLLILTTAPVDSTVYTNKFFEYLAIRRPILALAPPGPIRDLVEKERIGLAVPPNEPTAIAQGLLEMFENLSAEPESYKASPSVLEQFNRRALTGKLATTLDEVVNETKRHGTGQ